MGVDAGKIYRFFRPTLLVLGCFAIALALSRIWLVGESDQARRYAALASRIKSAKRPDPQRQPKEVVQIQVAALRSGTADGVLQCMLFASPDNLAVTGPLDRFGQMLATDRFAPLSRPGRVLIGKTVLVDGKARILVTLVAGQDVFSYVWVLSKQTHPSVKNCWMTDLVLPVKQSDEADHIEAIPGEADEDVEADGVAGGRSDCLFPDNFGIACIQT